MSPEINQKNRLKLLIAILTIAVITFLIFLIEQKIIQELPEQSSDIPPVKTFSIDTNILKDPFLQALQPFEPISLPEDIEIGRENPFIPY